jgi:hypothetical protein
MLPAIILSIAALAAGHPVQVSCDVEVNPPPGVTPQGLVLGWTFVPSDEIHLSSQVCEQLQKPPETGMPSFTNIVTWPVALYALIHESIHASGVRSEACANLYTLLTASEMLARFGVNQYNHALYRGVLEAIVALNRMQVEAYAPRNCDSVLH